MACLVGICIDDGGSGCLEGHLGSHGGYPGAGISPSGRFGVSLNFDIIKEDSALPQLASMGLI